MIQRAMVGALIGAALASMPLHAQTPDLSAALIRLEATLPARDWRPTQQEWSPRMVRQVAALYGEDKGAERVTKSWKDGRSLVWMHTTRPGVQVGFSVARLENESAARSYFGFIVDLQRKVDEQATKTDGPFLKVLETKSQSPKLAGVAETVWTEKRVRVGGAEPTSVTTLLARFGDTVVECAWYGAKGDLTLADHLIRELRK